MDYISKQIERLIDSAKHNEWFSERKLASGICTHGMLRKIKKGAAIKDPRFLTILMQRLGKSANKLELIVSKSALQIMEDQILFDRYIDEDDIDNAVLMLESYRKIAEQRLATNIEKMYYWRNDAMLKHYCLKDYKGALESITRAIEETAAEALEIDINQRILSSIELENFLELWYLKSVILHEARNASEIDRLAERILMIEQYVVTHITDEEEVVSIMSKYIWLKAQINLYLGKNEIAVKECVDILKKMQRYAFLQMLPGILEIIVEYGKDYMDSGEYDIYTNYFNAINFLLNDSGMSGYKWQSFLIRKDRTIYHCDSSFISNQRHFLDISQEEVAERAGISIESVSRIETGRTSPTGFNCAMIMKALGIDAEKYNTIMQTADFELVEEMWSVCVEGFADNYIRGEEILKKLKRDINIDCISNQAMIMYLENAISLHNGTSDFAKEIGKAKELLSHTYNIDADSSYRVPLLYEFELLLTIAIRSRIIGDIEEVRRIYGSVIERCENDCVDLNLRQRIYGVALFKNAYIIRDFNSLKKALRYEVTNRSYHWAGTVLCGISCELYSIDREKARRMCEHSYWLSKLANNNNYADDIRKLIKEYYQ